MLKIVYNPFYKFHKNPVGAVEIDQEMTLTVNIPKNFHISDLKINIYNDSDRKCFSKGLIFDYFDDHHNFYKVTFAGPKAGLYWYCFEFNDCYGTHFIGSSDSLDAQLVDSNPKWWQLLIHHPFKGELNWIKGKVYYQIFVDRFYRDNIINTRDDVIIHDKWEGNPLYLPVGNRVLNNDFFGGNLQGIIKKLDYLTSLNVGIIYLNPIFEAYSNHKYDTADYMKIDSMFGSEEDFIELCSKAKKRGIYIVLDGVFNHTGDNSVYFNKYGKYPNLGAYQSKESPYYSWYSFEDFPNKYHSWWGFEELPSLNQKSEDYIEYITGKNGVLNKWLSLGARGFRFDVIDELSNGFVDKLHETIKNHDPENLLLGEVWEDASNKMAYGVRKNYFNGRQIDCVMNYPLKDAILNFVISKDKCIITNTLRKLINNYPKQTMNLLMNHLGTHDTIRLINNFYNQSVDKLNKDQQASYIPTDDEYKKAIRLLKMASAIQYTLPGSPSIYYGDEVGLDGWKDPFCRKPFPWDNMNTEILSWYKLLGKLRVHKTFIDGEYTEYYINNPKIFAFQRKNKYGSFLIIANNSESSFTLNRSGYDFLESRDVNELLVEKQAVKILRLF